jgi:hypothetical protein
MPYKTLELRRENYRKNKDKINKKRRERNNLPEIRKRNLEVDKKWRDKNKEKLRKLNKKYSKNYRDKLKNLVLEHYGKKCACCGESNIKFLTIDHINGGGTKHRKKINTQINYWLVKNNFPKGFQTLCFNCNWGKHINGGICPHKE